MSPSAVLGRSDSSELRVIVKEYLSLLKPGREIDVVLAASIFVCVVRLNQDCATNSSYVRSDAIIRGKVKKRR